MRQHAKQGLIDLLCILSGSALYAGAITLFIRPQALVTGGFAGLSLIFGALFGVPVGATMAVLNLPLFAIGFRKLGKSFILKSLLATATAAILTDLTQAVLPPVHCEKILACIAGGVLTGMGLSLVLRRGGSTGGADIISKLIHAKWEHLPLGKVIMVIDFCVIALSIAVFGKLETALYSALMIAISATTVDYCIYGAGSGKLLLVVTTKPKTLSEKITGIGNRGATIVPVIGAYTNTEKKMLLIVLKNHEIGNIKSLIRQNDPTAFTTLLDAREIIGRGFDNRINE